jgi:glycine cleavage system H lipoate-binding protein
VICFGSGTALAIEGLGSGSEGANKMPNPEYPNGSHNRKASGPLLKCVWMVSGTISYKLCDREFDCESCPFDQAIRETTPFGKHQEGYELVKTLFYHPSHVWARIEDEGRVRIGLDDFGQKLAGRIYSVKLPEVAMKVTDDKACWVIAHQSGESRLAAPVPGCVLQFNERLLLCPSLINHDPYGEGWVMVIQPERLMENLKALHYGEQAVRWHRVEIERLNREVMRRVSWSQPDVGATLQDGGLPLGNLSTLMNPGQALELIEMFLSFSIGSQHGPGQDRYKDDGAQRR